MSSPRDFIDDSDDYWRRDERTIKIHGPEGFAGMRLAGRLAAETLDFITPHVQPGISTAERPVSLVCGGRVSTSRTKATLASTAASISRATAKRSHAKRPCGG